MDKIHKIRNLLKLHNLDYYIVPLSDEYLNEYPPAHLMRLKWLTGFTGSSGLLLISQDEAIFFTDGRYIIQAENELDNNIYKIFNLANKQPWQYLSEAQNTKLKVGYNPALFSFNNIARYSDINLVAIKDDLVDKLWLDKQINLSKVDIHEIEYAGQSHEDKISNIANQLAVDNVDYAIITALDSICWLLNIRGRDIANTPFVVSQAIISKEPKLYFFVDESRLDDDTINHLGDLVIINPTKSIDGFIKNLTNKNVLLDKNNSPYSFFLALNDAHANIISKDDPCLLPKACKNEIELENMRNCHLTDGIALTKFLKYIDEYPDKLKLCELTASQKLLEFRKESNEFIEPSFDTIAGFGANGAIIHYRVDKESNKKFTNNNLFLVDSGGQYKKGTTDVTRTIAIGKPSLEHIKNFTLVLKGHIALATAIFPKGTTGSQLDVLARQFLWENGLDYDHGTGHGVGSFLSVHEGPQRISKFANNVALEIGMIISNEPGYYKKDEYGIRIENLVEVVKADVGEKGREFLKFDTLTKAPIDLKLVDFSMLSKSEINWLETYHTNVEEDLNNLSSSSLTSTKISFTNST